MMMMLNRRPVHLRSLSAIVGLCSCVFSMQAIAGPHIYPVHTPRGPAAAAAPAGAHLSYYGGRVVSNAQVIVVLWGGSGSYLPELTGTSSPNIASFYNSVLQSPYVDWLSEYNTAGKSFGGTSSNQTIGRGGYLQRYTITPSAPNDGTTISDTQIQSELARQINLGTRRGGLPAPSPDAAGNSNTYYALYFPSGKTITLGSQSSCVSGGFCAYHGTLNSSPEVYYGVHPDIRGGICSTGCGGSASAFSNQTSVASHELVEVITDPEVGIATTFAPPLSWYDATNNGEIGDLCNAQEGSVVGADGLTYTVQQEFSNANNACIVTAPAAAGGASDGPLPLWAYAALGLVLFGVARARMNDYSRRFT
jgi:hypothetical protein